MAIGIRRLEDEHTFEVTIENNSPRRWNSRAIRLVIIAMIAPLLVFGLVTPVSAVHCTVDVDPPSKSNMVGTSHTVTATVTQPPEVGSPVSGTTVDFSVGGTGVEQPVSGTATTTADGEATFTFSSTRTGTSMITASAICPMLLLIPEDTVEGTADKTWTAATPTAISVTPTADTNLVGQTHTVTSTLTDKYGNGVPGQTVTFTAAGTGAEKPPTSAAATDDEGQASYSFTSTQTGTSQITATNGSLTANASKQWVTTPTAETLDLNPETDSNPTGTTHTVTATARDGNGQVVSGTLVDFEYSGANDPDDSDSPQSPDAFCTTVANGMCSVSLFGAESEVTEIRGWIDEDGSHGQTPTHGAVEADTEEEVDETDEPGDEDEPDNTDAVEKLWTEPTSATTTVIDCDPETATNTVGEDHEVNCTATQDGDPVSGTAIDGENLNGANDPDNAVGGTSPDYDDFCTTNSAGTCTATVPADDEDEGTADLCFWADTDDDSQVDMPGTTGSARPEDGDGCNEEAVAAEGDGNSTDLIRKGWEGDEPPPPTEPGTLQLIPEGHTGDGFTTFILIANPNDFTVTSDVTFLTLAGPEKPFDVQNIVLEAFERLTINVNATLGLGHDVATKIESEGGGVVAEGSMHFGGSRANSDMVAVSQANSQWFHAEGATHNNFQTFIQIANPDEDQATTVDLTYFTGGQEIDGPDNVVIPAGSRRTVHVNATCGGCEADIATMVEVVGANPDVVSAMAIHKIGAFDLGMGASVGSPATADTWVIPEGAEHSGWSTFITIANPNDSTSTVNVTYMLAGNEVDAGNETIPARSRRTLDITIDCGEANPNIANPCEGQDVATIVERVGGSPIVVEGTIQKEDGTGFVIGDSIGSSGADIASTTSDLWISAEGATHSGFTTFILLSNPLDQPVTVDLTIQNREGDNLAGQSVPVPAKSRETIDIRETCFDDQGDNDPSCLDDLWTFAASEDGGFVMELAIDWAQLGVGFSKGRSLSAKLVLP